MKKDNLLAFIGGYMSSVLGFITASLIINKKENFKKDSDK